MAESLMLAYAGPDASTTISIGGDVDLYYSINNDYNWQQVTAPKGETQDITLNQWEAIYLKSPGAQNDDERLLIIPKSYSDIYRIKGYLCALTNDGASIHSSNLHHELQGLFSGWTLQNYGLNFGFYNIPEEGFKELFANSTIDTISYNFGSVESVGAGAFKSMFENCKNLTTFPADLFSFTDSTWFSGLSENCFERMFAGCDKITQLPADFLRADNLPANCYKEMFADCALLEKVNPGALKAVSYDPTALAGMFMNCGSLNYVSVEFTTWPDGGNADWLSNVAAVGEFDAPKALPKTRGDSYIPQGWSIPAFNPERCLRFSNLNTGRVRISIAHSPVDDSPYLFSSDGGITWAEGPVTLQYQNVVYVKGTNYPAFEDSAYNEVARFVIETEGSAEPQIEGSIMSLVDNGGGELDEIADGFGFAYLFAYNTWLGSCQSPSLCSASKLSKNCYKGMFLECSNLHYVCPSMLQSATVLAESCCEQMFKGTKIKKAPKLPVKTLAKDCYKSMFENDQEILNVEVGFTDFNNGFATTDWLKNTEKESVTKTGVFWCPEDLVIPTARTESNVPEWFERDTFLPLNLDKCFTITVNNIADGVDVSYTLYHGGAWPDIFRFSRDGKFWVDSRVGLHVNNGETIYVAGDVFPMPTTYDPWTPRGFVFSTSQTFVGSDAGITLGGSLTSFIDGGAGELYDFDNPHWLMTRDYGTFAGAFEPHDGISTKVRVIGLENTLFNFKNVKLEYFFERMFYRQRIKELPKDLFKTIEELDAISIFSGTFSQNNLSKVANLPDAKLCYTYPVTENGGIFVNMYEGNLELTTVDIDVIPKNLVTQARLGEPLFGGLFQNCENLNEISVNFKIWKDESTADIQTFAYWAQNVADTGDFYSPKGLAEIYDGSHIPFAWTLNIIPDPPKFGKVTFLGKYSMSSSL